MAKKKTKVGNKTAARGKSLLNPSSPVVKYGAIVLGFAMGTKINDAIDKMTGGKIDTKIIAGGQVGLGALLAFKKGKPSLVTSVVGGVLLGAGAKRAMGAFGIGGFYDVPAVGGFYDVKAVNGNGASRKRINGSMDDRIYASNRGAMMNGSMINRDSR